MDTPLFSESQKFRQKWLWILLLITLGFTIYGVIQTPKEKNGMDILWSIGVLVLVILGFWILTLETKIDQQGVYYRFFPIAIRMRRIEWNEIERIFVRKYNPLLEYGGWGWRYSLRNGRAFNVSGNMGLQLELTNRRKVLLGTQKPEELEMLLQSLSTHGIKLAPPPSPAELERRGK